MKRPRLFELLLFLVFFASLQLGSEKALANSDCRFQFNPSYSEYVEALVTLPKATLEKRFRILNLAALGIQEKVQSHGAIHYGMSVRDELNLLKLKDVPELLRILDNAEIPVVLYQHYPLPDDASFKKLQSFRLANRVALQEFRLHRLSTHLRTLLFDRDLNVREGTDVLHDYSNAVGTAMLQ